MCHGCPSILQSVYHCRSQVLHLACSLHISFVCTVPSCTKEEEHRCEGLIYALSGLLCVQLVVDLLCSAMGSCQQFVDSLRNSLDFFGGSYRPVWPTTQLDITTSQYRKLHLVTRDGQLGLSLSLIIWQCPSDIIFICIYFRKLYSIWFL